MSWKHLEDVLKTHDQDKYTDLGQDALKMCSEDERLRQIYSSWSRRLQDVNLDLNKIVYQSKM